ncbi:LysM peptidoglycan-binding domain-containing protein [Bdellovibrio sp. NC01]|uniref:LysM peptidoglycan-binding domain-containing protein n=1 Tax=Bdellovibrio sp. NC01 TaxID=2220073 RepID=UPI00115B2C95|nr:LysM domain-containing protein [Bdellovibrio sp. NC01]QDK38454.1 hypothetical protein DOE51_13145 [Bdellovibrio sp. NC01]
MLKRTLALALITLPVLAFADTTYVVREGDTVLKIADKILASKDGKKDPRRYAFAKKIVAANSSIEDSNLLSPGQSIVIPEVEEKKKKVIQIVMDENDKSTVEASAQEVDETAAPGKQPIVVGEAEALAPVVVPPTVATAATEQVAKTEPQAAVQAEIKKEEKVPELPVAKADLKLPKDMESEDFITITPSVEFSNFKVKNRSTLQESEVRSKVNTGLDVQFEKSLNEKTSVLFNLGFSYVQLDQFDDGVTELSHTIQWHKRVSLGLAYALTPRLHFEAKVEGADRLFIIPESANHLDTVDVFNPGAEITVAWDFIHTNSSVVAAALSGHYYDGLTEDGVTYKSSFDPAGSIYWVANADGKMKYRLSVDYSVRNQGTDLTEQREESLGFGASLVLPW